MNQPLCWWKLDYDAYLGRCTRQWEMGLILRGVPVLRIPGDGYTILRPREKRVYLDVDYSSIEMRIAAHQLNPVPAQPNPSIMTVGHRPEVLTYKTWEPTPELVKHLRSMAKPFKWNP